MTNRRPCILVTMLWLLAVAASASAEGGWVLWEHADQKSWWRSHMLWTPLGTVASLAECEKEAARHKQMSETLSKAETKAAPYMAWRCFPDSVDPRGSKERVSAAAMFWWNWWVNVVLALATIGVVLVALFGQAFRAKFFPPILGLRLSNPGGEATREQAGPGFTIPARYYHVSVRNARRWAPATGVHVVLVQVEEPGPDGASRIIWRGDIPFGWRHQVLFPVERTIGPEAHVDLCSIRQGGPLRLHLLITPFNLETDRQGPQHLVLTLRALGDETESANIRVRIDWDGDWREGEAEMRGHLAPIRK